ncbi:MAG: hypothetical protein ACKVP0_20300 [Pirellulaceae bacterium]
MTMVEAAQQQGVPVDRISFVDVLRWLATTPHPEILPPFNLEPLRPGRFEPRCRKRRPKTYSLMNQPRAKLKQLLESQEVTDKLNAIHARNLSFAAGKMRSNIRFGQSRINT